MDELDVNALLDAEAARLLGQPLDTPTPQGDIEVPAVPMFLAGIALPDGQVFWMGEPGQPVYAGQAGIGSIVYRDGRLWRVTQAVTYLRLSPYEAPGDAAEAQSRETSPYLWNGLGIYRLADADVEDN